MLKARHRTTGEVVLVCEECEALWRDGQSVSVENFVDFGTYFSEKGIPTNDWLELELLDDVTLIDPWIVARLTRVFEGYRQGVVGVTTLKAALWDAANALNSPGTAPLRSLIQSSEGKIDTIQFTVDAADVRAAIVGIVDMLQVELMRAVSGK